MTNEPPPTNATELDAAKRQYIAEKQACGLKPETIHSYENALSLAFSYIPVSIKNTPLDYWTQYDVDLITNNILEGRKMKTGEQLAPQTRETYLRNLRQFVKWCREKKFISENIIVRKYKAPQAPPKMYTEEEIYKLSRPPELLERLPFTEMRNYVICMVLIETGMRRKSLVNLRICDLDLQHNQIQVATSKNGNVYRVTISNNTVVLLDKYLMFRAPSGGGVQATDVLFCDEFQRPLTPDGLSTIMTKYIKSKGVKCRGLHSFRHTTATLMVKNGATVADVAMQTGHRDLRQVQNYVHAVTAMSLDKFNQFSPLANISH